jgi:hypothetical protein
MDKGTLAKGTLIRALEKQSKHVCTRQYSCRLWLTLGKVLCKPSYTTQEKPLL